MTFQEWLSFGLAVGCQLVVVVTVIATLKERVKRLELDVVNLWEKQNEAKEKHEMIVRIDAKLDMLITQFAQKQG
ncbi:hypothetical protein SJPD1_1046 [Sulfurospirillum diekertiae]|uniref:Uncharacterized protein n=1 Tax=Sulfurospirillum diekertiae TaxID=1854492 RepID=A0A290HBQ2_9BACT|nr:hypothetical protein [Sulfurospirillum diekertiae]ATB68887.1 hypothetical protein SJPD1_0773 [Sulfurospirillum diekertiae]ATB69158.1 hypothetical protein SJPD1_1046 [Sulfurospirillum diekertiae]